MQFIVSGDRALNRGVSIIIIFYFPERAYVNLHKGGAVFIVPLPEVGNRGNVDVIELHSIHYLRT